MLFGFYRGHSVGAVTVSVAAAVVAAVVFVVVGTVVVASVAVDGEEAVVVAVAVVAVVVTVVSSGSAVSCPIVPLVTDEPFAIGCTPGMRREMSPQIGSTDRVASFSETTVTV